MEELLVVYDGGPDRPESFHEFLDRFAAAKHSYKQEDEWLEASRERIGDLMDLARGWRQKPRLREANIPDPASDLRITARY